MKREKVMNIAIFTDTYYPENNGVANSTYELKKGLEELGHHVYVFTVAHPDAIPGEKGVFRIKSVPFPMLKERRIGCTIPRAWKKRMREIHPDIIHTQTEFVLGHLGRRIADDLGVPHIHTYHTIYEDYLSYLHMPDKTSFRRLARKFSRICCNHADEVIVPTGKVEALLQQYRVRRCVHVIPSGISLKKFENADAERVDSLRQLYGLEKEKAVLLYVGRLSEEKNLEELIQFMSSIPASHRVRMLVVGDGPERESLEQRTKELHLEEIITFTGMVSFDEIENYYALGDIFVSGSTSETQGLTYVEALAAGLPLLVREDECLNEVLREGENGISYRDEAGFLQGLETLLEKRTSEGICKEKIRESVKSYGTATFAGKVEELYNDTIKQYKGRRGRTRRRYRRHYLHKKILQHEMIQEIPHI